MNLPAIPRSWIFPRNCDSLRPEPTQAIGFEFCSGASQDRVPTADSILSIPAGRMHNCVARYCVYSHTPLGFSTHGLSGAKPGSRGGNRPARAGLHHHVCQHGANHLARLRQLDGRKHNIERRPGTVREGPCSSTPLSLSFCVARTLN